MSLKPWPNVWSGSMVLNSSEGKDLRKGERQRYSRFMSVFIVCASFSLLISFELTKMLLALRPRGKNNNKRVIILDQVHSQNSPDCLIQLKE